MSAPTMESYLQALEALRKSKRAEAILIRLLRRIQEEDYAEKSARYAQISATIESVATQPFGDTE